MDPKFELLIPDPVLPLPEDGVSAPPFETLSEFRDRLLAALSAEPSVRHGREVGTLAGTISRVRSGVHRSLADRGIRVAYHWRLVFSHPSQSGNDPYEIYPEFAPIFKIFALLSRFDVAAGALLSRVMRGSEDAPPSYSIGDIGALFESVGVSRGGASNAALIARVNAAWADFEPVHADYVAVEESVPAE